MDKELWLTPFRYAQMYAVQKLIEEIERRGGTIRPWKENTTLHIRDTKEPERYPDIECASATWSGWQINFDLDDYHYEIWADDNPFFPALVTKTKIGEKRRAMAEEFPFQSTFSRGIDYRKINPEEEETPKVLDALIKMKPSKVEHIETITYQRRRYY